MAENNTTSVTDAFEILIEEMETEIEMANQVVSQAVGRSDYSRARELMTRAEDLTKIKEQVASLQGAWTSQVFDYTEEEEEKAGEVSERRNFGRLAKGLRTPATRFHLPMLRILAEHEGPVRVPDVTARIEEAMRDVLTEADYTTLPSSPTLQRWRHSAYWARWQLAQQGLAKSDSERGYWEITDKGRQYFAEQGS